MFAFGDQTNMDTGTNGPGFHTHFDRTVATEVPVHGSQEEEKSK